MAVYKSTFKCTVMTPDALLFEDEVQSLFLTGDHGEYEILPYHYPVLGILKRSDIIIDWKSSIPINFAVLRFFANDCIVLAEPIEGRREKKKEQKDEEDDIAVGDDDDQMTRDLK